MANAGEVSAMRDKVNSFIPLRKHDKYAIEVVKSALSAAEQGNFGVGAILVDRETGEIAYSGQNRLFTNSRSDLHAEMDVLNSFETANGDKSMELAKKYSLFTSLESCPMCLCRIISSGIPEVYHLADDPDGGMVHLYDQLPAIWRKISQGRTFAKADCSDELIDLANKAFLMTVQLNDKFS